MLLKLQASYKNKMRHIRNLSKLISLYPAKDKIPHISDFENPNL